MVGHGIVGIERYGSFVLALGAYREFEKRAGTLTIARGAKSRMILEAIDRVSGHFKVADLQKICPGVGVDLIRLRLSELKKAKNLEPSG